MVVLFKKRRGEECRLSRGGSEMCIGDRCVLCEWCMGVCCVPHGWVCVVCLVDGCGLCA